MFVHSWFLYKRIPCVTVSALQPTQMYLPYNMYINTSLLHLPVRAKWEVGRHLSSGTSLTVGCWNDRSLLRLTSTRYWLPCSIWCFCLRAGGLTVQLWCMREFLLEQSITSLKKKKDRGREWRRGTDVGGGLLTALTAVRDERPFRAGNDLTSPVGGKPSLTSAPTASSILGHFERPQRGSGVTADQQEGEENQNMDGAVSSCRSKRL